MLQIDELTLDQDGFTLSASLALEAGRFLAVLGPSGAGKSTLLGAIAGFVPISGGTISWDGNRIDGLPPGDRPVAMLFQDNNLFPHLSVLQNVALAVTTRSRPTPEVAAMVESALTRVGLAGFGDRKPGTLSGGEQSRVALARVLLQDKPLVLLDEPFSALGPGQRADMMALCRDVLGGAGRTVLFVTHDPADAARADDISVVVGGRVDPPVQAAALLADPPDSIRSYLGT